MSTLPLRLLRILLSKSMQLFTNVSVFRIPYWVQLSVVKWFSNKLLHAGLVTLRRAIFVTLLLLIAFLILVFLLWVMLENVLSFNVFMNLFLVPNLQCRVRKCCKFSVETRLFAFLAWNVIQVCVFRIKVLRSFKKHTFWLLLIAVLRISPQFLWCIRPPTPHLFSTWIGSIYLRMDHAELGVWDKVWHLGHGVSHPVSFPLPLFVQLLEHIVYLLERPILSSR